MNPEEITNRRGKSTEENINKSNINKELENKRQQNLPETLTNPIYTPAFLREQIGKLMRVEFLIGTNTMTDRIGILEDVGASYILLRSFENDSLVYCDIYAIKFITISTTGFYGTMNASMMNNNRYYQAPGMPNF